MDRVLKVILAIILASGLLIAGCSTAPEQRARTGSQAPDFRLPALEGQTVSLSNFQGKPVLINFWAVSCPPCRFEMPFIQQVYEEWSDKGLVILAINIGENPSTVKRFIESYGFSFLVLLDTRGDVALKYGIRLIPVSLFIDKNGIIQAKIIGAFPNKAAIERSLNKIIP